MFRLRALRGALFLSGLLLLPGRTIPAQSTAPPAGTPDTQEIKATDLADRIHGGLLGQLLGNLNGLPHEFKYINEPGDLTDYRPSLPQGARTDDDTDIEWTYIVAIHRTGTLLLPAEQIVTLWKEHLNDHIWSANNYARKLMDLGIEPPLTGSLPVNPWSGFNLAGQFTCETFALTAPGLPQAASRTALHYVHVAVQDEPAQATQLFASLIALAFFESDIPRLVESATQAVDPTSQVAGVITFVRDQCRKHPEDWKATRLAIRDRYTLHGGDTPDRNGYALNTAAVLASLLHGRGDFAETLRLAFNFGWDADCNAATAGAVLGVIQGHKALLSQCGPVLDLYRNTTRPGLPEDETISRFSQRIFEIASRQISANGGQLILEGEKQTFRIPRHDPSNVEPLVPAPVRREALKARQLPSIEADLTSGDQLALARAVYLAFAFDETDRIRSAHPEAWKEGVAHLKGLAPSLLDALARSSGAEARALKQRAVDAGVVTGR